MREIVYTINPDEYRVIADLVGVSEGSAEIREIANRVEANGEYSVIRPAYRVTFLIDRTLATGPKSKP